MLRVPREEACPPLQFPHREFSVMTHRRAGRITSAGSVERPFPRMVLMPHGGGDRYFFLRNSREIEHVKQHGRRHSTAFFKLLTCRLEGRHRESGSCRFGDWQCRRRNRAKRLFRELSRQVRTQLMAGQAFLVFPKKTRSPSPFDSLKQAWRTSLKATIACCD